VTTENGYIVTVTDKSGEQKNYVALNPQDVLETVREQLTKGQIAKKKPDTKTRAKVEDNESGE
jgi:hypothetical protein